MTELSQATSLHLEFYAYQIICKNDSFELYRQFKTLCLKKFGSQGLAVLPILWWKFLKIWDFWKLIFCNFKIFIESIPTFLGKKGSFSMKPKDNIFFSSIIKIVKNSSLKWFLRKMLNKKNSYLIPLLTWSIIMSII